MTSRLAICLLALLAGSPLLAQEPDDSAPISAEHWARPFHPGTTSLVGSYLSMIQRGPEDFVGFTNSISGDLEAGLVMWSGTTPLDLAPVGIVFTHRLIDDVFGPDGLPFAKRRLTRPFITWHPEQGFIGIIHVCADYAPVDGRVYPAMVRSKTGKPGTWHYLGKLKGEIWAEFGTPGKPARWADGGGFFVQPDGPDMLDRTNPLANRYLFFSNQYPGDGCMALLYSADGDTWVFHRDEAGAIVNLTPMYAGRPMIFPHVIRLGSHGWAMFLSETWPPTAIHRLYSADGLTWQPWSQQPEIVAPESPMIKNLNGWYDPQAEVLHGYLSVWAKQPDGSHNYDKYHSYTEKLTPALSAP